MNNYQKQLLEKLVADTQDKLTPTAKEKSERPRTPVLLWNLVHGNYNYSFADFEAVINYLTTQP